MSLDRETVHELKNSGMTFEAIGKMYGKTRQYIWNLYTGYDTIYKRENEGYKMKKRHRGHTLGTKLNKPCFICVNEQSVKGVVTV